MSMAYIRRDGECPVMSEFVVHNNAGAKPGVREAMWGEL